MGTASDWGVVFGEEATYNTAVVPARALPVRSTALNIRRTRQERDVYRVGSSKVKGVRDSVVTLTDAAGPAVFQVSSRGFGILWEACLGAGASTIVPASTTYQQVFTLGDGLRSLTFQELLPALKADFSGYDTQAFTFTGAIVESWELSFPNNDLVQLTVNFDCGGVSTSIAAVTPSYTARNLDNAFHFGKFCLYTGTLTAPTTTALASATTQWARAKSLTVNVSNGLTGGGPYVCTGKGRQTPGQRTITGTLVVEYVSGGPVVDAIINDTPLVLLGTCGTNENAEEKLQVVLPAIKLGDQLPTSNRGETIELSVPFEGLVPDAGGEPLWIVQRTLDIAL